MRLVFKSYILLNKKIKKNMFKLFFTPKTKRKNLKSICHYSSTPTWNALFFGSDHFSLYSLKLLYSYYLQSKLFNKLEVVTNVTKNPNVVQKFAEKQNLTTHNWPHIPQETTYDVGLVVSFGYLIPEATIQKFSYGVLNVHASLLPRWRGAAPIIYALANGDTETGITIMRIKPHKFDIGDILLQEKIVIGQNTEMPELHQSLGELGAISLVKTIIDLPNYIKKSRPQPNYHVTYAPKVNPNFAIINWNQMTSLQVYNLHRALKGFLVPISKWQGVQIKLYGIKLCQINCDIKDKKPGCVKFNKRTKLLTILCANNEFVSVENVGLLGKKVMTGTDFNNGFLCKVTKELRHFE